MRESHRHPPPRLPGLSHVIDGGIQPGMSRKKQLSKKEAIQEIKAQQQVLEEERRKSLLQEPKSAWGDDDDPGDEGEPSGEVEPAESDPGATSKTAKKKKSKKKSRKKKGDEVPDTMPRQVSGCPSTLVTAAWWAHGDLGCVSRDSSSRSITWVTPQ